MGSYWKDWHMTLASDQTLAGAFPEPRRGPTAAARSEQSGARRVAAPMVADRPARRHRLVAHVSPRPRACGGAAIERGFERVG